MKDELIAFLEKYMELPKGSLKPETEFQYVVDDSLSFLEMMISVREKFGPISNARLTAIETVGDLIDYYATA